MSASKTAFGKKSPGRVIQFLALCSVVVFSFWGPSALACVGCREPGSDTMTNEPSTVLAGIGLSWGVLFMLAFAFLLVGGLSMFIWATCSRIERDRARQ